MHRIESCCANDIRTRGGSMTEDRTIPSAPLPLAYPETIRRALELIWDPRCDVDAPKAHTRERSAEEQDRHKARVFALDRALEASEAHYGAG